MTRIATLLLVFAATPASAASPTWNQATDACTEAITEGAGCASCAGLIPDIARCAAHVAYPMIQQSKIEHCIHRVEDAMANHPQSNDRLTPIGSCLAR